MPRIVTEGVTMRVWIMEFRIVVTFFGFRLICYIKYYLDMCSLEYCSYS